MNPPLPTLPRQADQHRVRAGQASLARRGLTIVELLVSIAIVAILVGILMPGLQMARESARRSGCSNNMRQIAMAMRIYADARRYLPGWRNAIKTYSAVRAQTAPEDAAVSWTVPILPQLEEPGVYDWYSSSAAGSPAAAVPPQLRIDTYRCPSQVDVARSSRLSYAVNAGSSGEVLDNGSFPAQQYAADGVFIDAVGNLPSDPLFDASRRSYAAGRVSFKDLSADGTSTTVMLSERSGPAVPDDISWAMNPRVVRANRGAIKRNHTILQPLPIGSGPRTQISVINPTAETRPQPSPIPADANVDDWNVRYPSSRHPGAVNVAFCDGRVRSVREAIDAWVYSQLLSSAGHAASAGVQDCQQALNAAGVLVPYTFNPADLVR